MAEIELAREVDFVDHLRAYRVLLDGDQIGEIRSGETLVYDVGPGRHEFQLKISWCWSRKIQLDLDVESSVRLRCRPSNLLTVFYGITFGRHEYIKLEVV
jgi:hypothetical protein